MTRSRKKAICHCSLSRTAEHRRRERRKVKEILRIDPDSDMLYADPKELGHDEWGTWFDLEFNYEEHRKDIKERMRRK